MKVGDAVEFFSAKSNKKLKAQICDIFKQVNCLAIKTSGGIVYEFQLDSGMHLSKSGGVDTEYVILTINGVRGTVFFASAHYVNALATAEFTLGKPSSSLFGIASSTSHSAMSIGTTISGSAILAGAFEQQVANLVAKCTCPMNELLMRGCQCPQGKASLLKERNNL